MTPRERAWHYMTGEGKAMNELPYSGLSESDFIAMIERVVTADRAQLQAEMVKQIESEQSICLETEYKVKRIIQSVFSLPAQSEQKPKCGHTFSNLDGKEKRCTLPKGHLELHMNTEFDPDCSCCVQAAKEQAEENAKIKTVSVVTHENLEAYAHYIEKVNDWQSDRIATLHQWLVSDREIIKQQAERIEKLQEEKNGLVETITQCCRQHDKTCGCLGCDALRELRSPNR